MSNSSQTSKQTSDKANALDDMRQKILHLLKHFEHILPAQAPIKDFVHHNTLHGYQHLTFPEALAQSQKTTGAKGYLSGAEFRHLFAQGRINQDDLDSVLSEQENLALDQIIYHYEHSNKEAKSCKKNLCHKDIILARLLYPLEPITTCQMTWQIEELSALKHFQSDLNEAQRQYFLEQSDSNEEDSITALWQAVLTSLQLDHLLLHPEDMLDMSPDRAQQMLSQQIVDDSGKDASHSQVHKHVQKDSRQILSQLLEGIGHKITLGGFILAITGIDIMDDIRPVLLRHIAAYLDQGMAAWHPEDQEHGFYASWKQSSQSDLSWVFEDMDDWKDNLDALPDDPMETIIHELQRQGLSQDRWTAYLERLALELPGWSGMFLWRHTKPGYQGYSKPVNMLDYLAVRLVLERLFAQRVCSEYWRIEASLETLKYYFRHRSSDFLVRYSLNNDRLPEYLATLSAHQIERAKSDASHDSDWLKLANMIWTWQHSPVGTKAPGNRITQHAWPLFRLCQFLGLNANDIATLEQSHIDKIFALIQQMDEQSTGFIWLQAYEHHYHEIYFNALTENEGRGRWKERKDLPDAQLVFCMDDREEGIRRHLEELNPNIETFGAAAHFGVPMNWRGLDAKEVTSLTPVVFIPTHEFQEVACEGQDALLKKHKHNLSLRLQIKTLINQETRRNLLSSAVLMALSAPVALFTLAAKLFAPTQTGELLESIRDKFDVKIKTRTVVTCTQPIDEPTPEHQQMGYTDTEQVDKIEIFLRLIGLVNGFSPFIVIVGHGSMSQNNPHLAAYNCGACSGRHSGPNARIWAAIANRPEIRKRLKERGLDINDNTWFLGSSHNTCDEKMVWYDTDLIPEKLQTAFKTLKQEVYEASQWSAHERCRRLASAPHDSDKETALKHIIGRSHDISQARPELGHATNAICFIGRRSATQGAFFDRRIFLISYDPSTDPEGYLLEKLLLANGPVGAGISLEYYFSTVDNERYGSGSKVTHNVNGLLGVMDGSSGDLRTGLPRQMIEIHEAMRLQIVVEHSIEILTRIYTDQPAIQELVGNGWILLTAKDPNSKQLTQFKPNIGFVPWHGKQETLTEVKKSPQWYSGHSDALNLALVTQPDDDSVRGRQPSIGEKA